jgi:hypothetical protein
MLKDVLRNKNPGAGEYEFDQMHTFSHNQFLDKGWPHELNQAEKAVPMIDNKVPGPGNYDPDDHLPIPNFKLMTGLPETKQHRDWIEMTEVKKPVGPQHY